jgi:hypothetical protein
MIEERVKFLYNLYWVITGLAFLWFVLMLTPWVSDNLPGLVLLLLGVPLWYYMKHLAGQNEIEIPVSTKGGVFMLIFMCVMVLGVVGKIIWVFKELIKDMFEGRDIIVQVFGILECSA